MNIPKTDHENVIATMRKRSLMWTALMLAFFLAVMGGVVYQIDHNAQESCAATNKVIDVMVAYNESVIAFSKDVQADEFQRRAVELRRENNRLLEAARCTKK